MDAVSGQRQQLWSQIRVCLPPRLCTDCRRRLLHFPRQSDSLSQSGRIAASSRRNAPPGKKGNIVQRLMISLLLLFMPLAARADQIPACALTGSMTMMIGGKPALRLSDVANCPKELYEVISSVQIDGQPMVYFKTGVAGKMRCAARSSATVDVQGKLATSAGDVSCSEAK
jgi:uncharacterized Zn-binding protein involved in type VI secretion